MGKDSSIAWTDHTFNPWWGCTEASPGCDHCYAKAFSHRLGFNLWGKGAPRRTFGDAHWRQPLAWNAAAKAEGVQKRVFCLSMGDVMDDEAPELQRDRLWDLVDVTPYLLWLLLTKRASRYPRYLPKRGFRHDNVLLGATTESQPYWNVRVPELKTAAAELMARNVERRQPAGPVGRVLTFASYEPAIGPIDPGSGPMPDQVIFGGESGAGRRPMKLGWAREMERVCRLRKVAFFMKQMSASTPDIGASLIPVDMLIRQFPGETE